MAEAEHYLKRELYELVRTDWSVLEFLQHGALDGIWYWDIEHPENEWMSPGFWTAFGYDPLEKSHLASEWQDMIHPDDLKVALENFSRHCEDPNHPYDQVVRYQHKDGSTVWVRCRGMAIRDDNGKPTRMLGAHTDITQLKRAEEDLAQSRRFLDSVFDAIQDGISVLDPDLNIIHVNQKMKEWYGHNTPLEGRKCYEVYHGRSTACEVCPTIRAFESGGLEVNEVPYVKDNNEQGVLELFAYPMLDDSGHTVAIVEYVRDISERKKAEKLLKERQQIYQSLFEDSRSIMLLIEPNTGAIFDANPSACSFYGYSKEDLTGMVISDINTLTPEEVRQEMALAESGNRNYFNFSHRLSDGSIREVEVYSGPITVRGRSLLCSIIHDVSKRKAVEEDRERLIGELEKALSEVKTLRGVIPICASCMKIRDDKGSWGELELYIRQHSEADFSHGICPACARELYPDLDIRKER